jgi:large subunit ribosomal protein L28
MAQCEYCDKKPAMGNQIEHRGKAKYLGGVGTKVTGISRREFKPNLQRVKITTPNGTTRYARVCTRCLKKGVVRKAVQQAPFKLPVSLQKGQGGAAVAAPAKAAPVKGAPAKAAAPAKGAATKASGAKGRAKK